MLIVLIAYLISLGIVILIFSMIILITLHVWIRCWFDLTCRFSGLYIILIVFEHGILITIHPDSHSLYVCMSDISCTLLDYMMHDCSPSA